MINHVRIADTLPHSHLATSHKNKTKPVCSPPQNINMQSNQPILIARPMPSTSSLHKPPSNKPPEKPPPSPHPSTA